MFIIAPVNQFSRLLAKLRMAWVKAPVAGGREVNGEKKNREWAFRTEPDNTFKVFPVWAKCALISLELLCAGRFTTVLTYWGWVSIHQGWASPPESGTAGCHTPSSSAAPAQTCTAPPGTIWADASLTHCAWTRPQTIQTHSTQWMSFIWVKYCWSECLVLTSWVILSHCSG